MIEAPAGDGKQQVACLRLFAGAVSEQYSDKHYKLVSPRSCFDHLNLDH